MSTAIPFPIPVAPDSPFPLGNIPFGIFSTSLDRRRRPGTAIGDYVLDLRKLAEHGCFNNYPATIFSQEDLNTFSELGSNVRSGVRKKVQKLLLDRQSIIYKHSRQDELVYRRSEVQMHLPFRINGFTDYMCSLEHVINVGKAAGHSEAPASFYHMPLCYNGRASSVFISGTDFRRPLGWLKSPTGEIVFGRSQRLDFETELGFFVSSSVPRGELVPARNAREHIFGFVVLNDWSARDIQFLEMTPLGPFNGKNSCTSISPWVVTIEALEDAGALSANASQGDFERAPPVSFLACNDSISIQLSTYISRQGKDRHLLAMSNANHMHWSPFQMLAHSSSSGSGLSTGDLIGTGTLSSSDEQAKAMPGYNPSIGRLGCLQELTKGGSCPLLLERGETLTWLEDGDEVVMEAWAGSGTRKIGFGEVAGRIVLAPEVSES